MTETSSGEKTYSNVAELRKLHAAAPERYWLDTGDATMQAAIDFYVYAHRYLLELIERLEFAESLTTLLPSSRGDSLLTDHRVLAPRRLIADGNGGCFWVYPDGSHRGVLREDVDIITAALACFDIVRGTKMPLEWQWEVMPDRWQKTDNLGLAFHGAKYHGTGRLQGLFPEYTEGQKVGTPWNFDMAAAPKDKTLWGGHWERGKHANDMAYVDVIWWASGRWRTQAGDAYVGRGGIDCWMLMDEPSPPPRPSAGEAPEG